MSASSEWSIPWFRIFAEGFVIVVSILLAFGIDAWWDERQEAARRDALVESLRSDFQTTRTRLAESIGVGDEVIARIRGFLTLAGTEEALPLDVEGTEVRWSPTGQLHVDGGAEADEEGRFKIAGLAPGPHAVRAFVPDDVFAVVFHVLLLHQPAIIAVTVVHRRQIGQHGFFVDATRPARVNGARCAEQGVNQQRRRDGKLQRGVPIGIGGIFVLH